jgi:hypothetical protein
MPAKLNQQDIMRWVLFFVFITLFTVIVIATLLAVFFGVGQLTPSERDLLFKIFIIEIGIAVATLFYALFGLKARKGEQRIRIFPDDGDIKKIINKTAIFSPRHGNNILPDINTIIIDEDGSPECKLTFPDDTQSVYVSLNADGVLYEGSFATDAYRVNLRKQ